MSGKRPARGRAGVRTAAIHRPATGSGEYVLVAHEPPWSCVAEAFAAGEEGVLVDRLAESAGARPTFLVQERRGDPQPGGGLRARLRSRCSGAEVLGFEASSLLKFLWCYRDAHDPMALAHASRRTLFDETFLVRRAPDLRSGRRGERRRAQRAAEALLARTGRGLGVELPLPGPGDRWGLARKCGLLEAGAGLFAGVLYRWGSPLAVVCEGGGGTPRLELLDDWLLENRDRAFPSRRQAGEKAR